MSSRQEEIRQKCTVIEEEKFSSPEILSTRITKRWFCNYQPIDLMLYPKNLIDNRRELRQNAPPKRNGNIETPGSPSKLPANDY